MGILMAIPVISLLGKAFKAGKKLLAPKISKMLNLPSHTVEEVLAKAEEIAETDKEIQKEFMAFDKEMRGTYASLKTVFEKILRSIMYHLITIWACFLISMDFLTDKTLNPKVLVACISIILGRMGYRIYQHYKNDKNNGVSL